jgi:large subunit ribosomal protein L10
MLRAEKQATLESIRDRFARMTSAVFVDFTGLDVPTVTKLRDQLRAAAVEYKVVKNKLAKLAIKDQPYANDAAVTLRGMTGVAWCYEDPSAAAKIFKAFTKDNEKLKIKGGVVEGRVIDAEAVVNQLATMPGKDEVRAQLLCTMQAPAQQFLQQLQAPSQNFVYLLKAKEDQGSAA